jgi:addiction module HigA family antidote
MSPEKHTFSPDYAISPGEILEEMLETRGIKKAEFAERCGRPAKTISGILNGHVAITPETAIQFERVLGTAASLWTNLEARYRLRLAEREASKATQEQLDWAKMFPVAKLVEHEAIPKPADSSERVRILMEFFGVASVEAWHQIFDRQRAAYRQSSSFKSAGAAVASWIRMGEKAAEEIRCQSYDRGAFLEALRIVRSVTTERVSKWYPEMMERCAEAGVAVVLVRELPKTRLSGAARWLTKDKALIQLSLRHKRDDLFWFSFFHEAGHVLLHGKKQWFLDDAKNGTGEAEEEADRFAADFLIDPAAIGAFCERGDFGGAAIKQFADEQGIAPGIVVGRLQHEGFIEYRYHNKLKVQLKWADD